MKKSITSQTYISSLIYLLCGVMVFLLTLSVNSIYVSAEGSNSLPYYVNQNVPFDVPFTFEDVVNGAFDNPNYNITSTSGLTKDDILNCENYLLICNYYNPTYITFTYHILIEDNYNISLSNNNYDTFVAGTDYVNLTFNGYGSNLGKYVTLSVLWNPEVYTWQNAGFGYNGLTSIKVFNSNNNYPLNYPFAIKKDFVIGNDSLVVLGNYSEPINITGHATPPINNTGHFIPHPHPNKPTPNPYTPPTPQFPSIDTSTLEKLVESLIDVVEYGFSYTGSVISGWFSNLVSNVSDYLDYIGDLLVTGFNNVVGSIQDFATDFYNNMVSLIEPIFEFFSGVSNFFNSLIELGMVDGQFVFSTFISKLIVPDIADVVDLLTDNDTFGSHALFLASYHKIQFLINTFNNLQPIKVFTVPSTTWHGYTIGGFTVDFSWYDNFKVYMDLILSGFLIIGYLYWLFSSLNSLFRGTGSMVYDSLYETPTKGGEHH